MENAQKTQTLEHKRHLQKYRQTYTSEYIIDEATTLALVRTDKYELAIDVGKYAIDSPRIKILKMSRKDFQNTWEKFKSLSDEGLSFTDCSTLHLMEENRIDKIMSYDSGFDGFKERIC